MSAAPLPRVARLVVDLGDLPSLAALALLRDPEGVALWHPEGRRSGDRRRLHCAELHAGWLGVPLLRHAPWFDAPDAPGGPPPDPVLLALALAACRRTGARGLVWPVARGTAPEAMTGAISAAMLATEADLVAHGGPPIEIETPLVDLEPAEVLDLADDGGAPLDAFWPCADGAEHPCATCTDCRRWQGAFAARGFPWPWSPTPA